MIDLDQLDAQLERALTDDVRALRSGPPRPHFDHTPVTTGTASGAPKTLAEKLASIADDFDAPARPAAAAVAPAEPAPAPVPVRPYVDVADYVDVTEPEPAPAVAGPPFQPAAVAEPAADLGFDLEDLVDFAEPEARPAPRVARPAPRSRPASVMTDPPPARPPVARLTEVPFFEKRPSEVAATTTQPSAPAPNLVSARERLRQAAVRQAHGLTDDGAPNIHGLAARIPALLAQGLLDDLDHDLHAHATMASRVGSSDDRLAAAIWKVMRCALDGRRDEAQAALRVVNALGHGDERYWTQRFWLALEWGDEEERFAVLEHCWERAYRYDDLTWRAALCVLLARMGRAEEAAREVDAVLAGLQGTTPEGFADIVSNVAEAVFVLGDRTRAVALQRPLTKLRDHLVVTGPALTCKGASARFQAHVAWVTGNAAAADRHFAAAAETHRALGARPLLARTLQEWGATLAGRDDVRAQRCLSESSTIAQELGLAQPAPALAG